jgi:hypothetical protein
VGLSAAAGWISRRGIHLRGRGSGGSGGSSGSGSGIGGVLLGQACELSAASCAFEHSSTAGIADDAVTAAQVLAAAQAAAFVGVACDAVAARAGVEAAGATR